MQATLETKSNHDSSTQICKTIIDPLTSPLENVAHFFHTDSRIYQYTVFTPDNINAVTLTQAKTRIKSDMSMYSVIMNRNYSNKSMR